MADFVLKDAFILINAVNLSDHGVNVTLNYDADTVDNSAFADTSHSFLAGLTVKKCSIDFLSDEAASKVAQTIFPLVGAAAFAVEIRPTSGARSTTNPGYTFNAIVESFQPLGGGVGEMAKSPLTLVSGDGAAMLRQTA